MKKVLSFALMSPSKWVVLLSLLVNTAVVLNAEKWEKYVIDHDITFYYAYLPATFIYQDMSFSWGYKIKKPEGKLWTITLPNGKRALKMSSGLAVLWTPFFLGAHAVAHLFDYNPSGYSPPYHVALLIAGLFYGFLSLLITRVTLRRWFNEKVVAMTLLLLAFGTNFYHYANYDNAMAHIYGYFAFALFFEFCLRWYKKPRLNISLAIGAIMGLIVLIRPSNALVVLVPLFTGMKSPKDLPALIVSHLKNWKQWVVMTLGTFLVAGIQVFFWKWGTDQWVVYSYTKEGFFWSEPAIWEGLLGFRKGWLIYTPMMFFALIGMYRLHKQKAELFYPIIIHLLVHLYVIFSWWCWWYGGSFGSRPMVEVYAFLVLPLAYFVQWILKQQALSFKVISFALMALFLVLNIFQSFQYRRRIIHYDSMTWEAYKLVFLKDHKPSGYYDAIDTPDYDKAVKGETR